LVIQAPGGGYDAIKHFSLHNGGHLGLTTALASAPWDGRVMHMKDASSHPR
jgi:hypothetical protein